MFCIAGWTREEEGKNIHPGLLVSAIFVLLGEECVAHGRMPSSPVIGDDVYIHLVVALSILGQVANGFAVRFFVAVNPVEPNLLLLHLLMQQRGLKGGLRVKD